MLEYLISAISILITAICGSYFTKKNMNTYKKPKAAPPSFVFPIVWTILYIILFFAFANVIQKHDYITIGVFAINLLLNILWCYLYFELKNPVYAFICIIALLLTNFIILFRTIKLTRDVYLVILFMPYTLWLLFASYLNFSSI